MRGKRQKDVLEQRWGCDRSALEWTAAHGQRTVPGRPEAGLVTPVTAEDGQTAGCASSWVVPGTRLDHPELGGGRGDVRGCVL